MEEKYKKREKLQFQLCCLLAMIITMVGLAGTCLLLSGCQKSEIAILSDKQDEAEEKEKISESSNTGSIRNQLGIPEHEQEKFQSDEDKKTILKIDADVYVPDVDGMGEILVKPYEMTQERKEKIDHAFSQNEKEYDIYFNDWREEKTEDKVQYLSGPFSIVRVENEGDTKTDYGDTVYSEKELKELWSANGSIEDKRELSLKAAQKKAEEQIEKCGMGSFDCTDYYITPEIRFGEETEDNGMEIIYTGKAFYHFTFTKKYNQVPVITSDQFLSCQYEGQEKELPLFYFWTNERIEIEVDESGIASMISYGLLEETGMKKEYVNLLSFDEMKIICKKLFLSCLAKEKNENREDGIRTLEANIHEIRLGYMRTTDKDQLKEGKIRGILKPVWCFYGTVEIQYKNGDYSYYEDDRDELLLTMDAQTGEIVEYEMEQDMAVYS